MSRAREFHRFLIPGFLGAFVGTLFFFHGSPGPLPPSSIARLPGAVPGVRSAEAAKAAHLFWGGRVGSRGDRGAIDILRTPELFSAVFPGYPASMREDRSLWDDYFSREFDTKVTVERLSEGEPYGTFVYLPWLGCVDIFRRYGADVVIFGASEIAQAMPPDLVHRLLAPVIPDARVLLCTTPSAGTEVVMEVAKEMIRVTEGRDVRKPRWSIYGYNAVAAYVNSVEYDVIRLGKKAMVDAYRRNESLGGLGSWNRPMQTSWSWNDVIRLNKLSSHLGLARAWQRRKFDAGRWAVAQVDFEEAMLAKEDTIGLHVGLNPPDNPFLVGRGLDGCDWMDEAARRLQTTLGFLAQLTSRTMLFLSPTTWDEMKAGSKCYRPAVEAMVRAKASETITVLTDDWRAYGLKFADFAFSESGRGDRIEIDVVHANVSGARKIAARVTDAIVKAGGG